MKRIVFLLLGIVIFGMSSCMKPGENIQEFQFIPAIVDFSMEYGFFLKTDYAKFVPSGTQDLPGWDDAVLAFFTVNYDQQASKEYTVVYNFDYMKVDIAAPRLTAGGPSMTTGYDLPIGDVEILGWVDQIWFFAFAHRDVTKDDLFFYEMSYDSDEPIVYLRAAKSSSGKVAACAFNMSSFFYRYKDANNKVRFSIQYKSGVDDEGNDEYKPVVDNYGNSTIEITVE